MNRILFSEAARQDREEITAYTIERFGVEQARRLRQEFESALLRLVETPGVGRPHGARHVAEELHRDSGTE